MGLSNGITIRLDTETRERLEAIADDSGVKTSVLIRQAVSEYLDKVEKSGMLEIALSRSSKPARKKTA